jgi:hypothetical protein
VCVCVCLDAEEDVVREKEAVRLKDLKDEKVSVGWRNEPSKKQDWGLGV